jgi:hypothetical protein
MAIEKCCEHLCSKEPMAGAPERFERAKATWKEVTGEDVSHLQCPNEAKPEAATFASGVSNESQLGQRTDSPLPYEQQSADWRCGYDAAEQVWHAKTRGMRQQLRELRGPRTEPPVVHPSHLPTIVDLLEDEVAALRKVAVATKELVRQRHPHSGACCTFDKEGKVIVTRDSCKCSSDEKAVREAVSLWEQPPTAVPTGSGGT